MGNIFDCRVTGWGHSAERQWGSDDPTKIQGHLTPLPKVGDFICGQNNRIYRFTEVEYMGNPRDGYFARIEPTPAELDAGEQMPSFDDIAAFLSTPDALALSS